MTAERSQFLKMLVFVLKNHEKFQELEVPVTSEGEVLKVKHLLKVCLY